MLEIDARLTFEPDPHPFSHKVPYVSRVFGDYILLVNSVGPKNSADR